jgi:hypothetical protein
LNVKLKHHVGVFHYLVLKPLKQGDGV